MKPETIYFNSTFYPEFSFLSNFFRSPFTHGSDLLGTGEDLSYATVEHFYQAKKAERWEDHEAIRKSPTARMAKKLGQDVVLTPGWEGIKEDVMHLALCLKFGQNRDLAQLLLETGDLELVEFAPWGDRYWGVGKDYVGENRLGKLLMRVREEMKRT